MSNYTDLKTVSNNTFKADDTVSVATSVTKVNLTIDPTKIIVFFRLVHA